ncbi:unnamed protein product [Brassica rapa]|uniref:Uncharacterized protein n=1 Tax=Brassica campestris TaxID=3711 RepID=A0A8D9D1F4_BRACM|nr:unnamed protein product [Brassica rapa]
MPGAAHADSTTFSGKSSLPSAQPSSTNRSKSSAENVYKQGVPLVPPQLRTFFFMQHDVSCEKPRKDNEGQCSSNQLGGFLLCLIFIAFYKQFDFNAI